MRYVVAVKQVPDTALIQVDEHGSLVREGVPAILDPYSEHALETALSIKTPEDRVTVVTMGPPQAREALQHCLELGADEAFLLSDRAFAGADVHATARTLAVFIKRYAADAALILCGKQAADGDTGQVPAELAAQLQVPQFCYVTALDRTDGGFTAVQDYGDEHRTCRVPAGAVLSVAEGETNRRLPSIQRFLEAEGLPLTVLSRVDLMLGTFSVGLRGSRTQIVRTETVRSSRRGRVTDGADPEAAARFLKGVL